MPMNFFEQEERCRRKTNELVVVFIISVILIVAGVDLVAYGIAKTVGNYQQFNQSIMPYGDRFENPYRQPSPSTETQWKTHHVLVATTAVTLLIILGGSLYKIAALSGGGPAVAQLLGGVPIQPNSTSNEE